MSVDGIPINCIFGLSRGVTVNNLRVPSNPNCLVISFLLESSFSTNVYNIENQDLIWQSNLIFETKDN